LRHFIDENGELVDRSFIVDDDTTGQGILMNFEEMKRWKETKIKVPAMTVFAGTAGIAEMYELPGSLATSSASE
jgi:hypothetical protein